MELNCYCTQNEQINVLQNKSMKKLFRIWLKGNV